MSTLTLVNSTPVTLAAGTVFPLEVWNVGVTGIIYASRNAGVTPSNAEYVLPPNGHVSVPSGITLYVCTDTTAYGFYHSDGTTFDPGSFGISTQPPTRLANTPTLIATSTAAYTALAGAFVAALPVNLDVSSYSSLIFVITNLSTGGKSPAIADYIQLDVQLSASPVVLSQNVHAEYLLLDPGTLTPSQGLQVPVTQKYLLAITSAQVRKSAIVGYTGSITLNVYGSNEVITTPRYIGQGQGMLGAAPSGGAAVIVAAAGSSTSFIATKNGTAYVESAWAGGTGGLVNVQMVEAGIAYNIVSVQSGASTGLSTAKNTIFPMRPIILLATTNAASNQNLSVLQ